MRGGPCAPSCPLDMQPAHIDALPCPAPPIPRCRNISTDAEGSSTAVEPFSLSPDPDSPTNVGWSSSGERRSTAGGSGGGAALGGPPGRMSAGGAGGQVVAMRRVTAVSDGGKGIAPPPLTAALQPHAWQAELDRLLEAGRVTAALSMPGPVGGAVHCCLRKSKGLTGTM